MFNTALTMSTADWIVFTLTMLFATTMIAVSTTESLKRNTMKTLRKASDWLYWSVERPIRDYVSNALYRLGDKIHNIAYRIDIDW